MTTVTPLPAFNDNYIWYIASGGVACVVDPGDAAPVIRHLEHTGDILREVWITHLHPDHVGGLATLRSLYPSLIVRGPDSGHHHVTTPQVEGDTFSTGPEGEVQVHVWQIPGHTLDHLAFIMTDAAPGLHVFCGDTVFSAGCGRLFGGTPLQLHHSLARLAGLPGDTLFYPAHEYTLSNLRFAVHVEPANPHPSAYRDELMARSEPLLPTVPTPLSRELRINPFLRAALGLFQTDVSMSDFKNVSQASDTVGILRKMKDSF